MQPETAAEARGWFKKAALPPFIEDALFHCQQACEKAMKGFLTVHGRVFRKTHDLDELGRACESLDPTLTPMLDPARDLTVFAWEFRYPGGSEVPSEKEARQALGVARSVYDALLSRLPDTVHP